MGAFEELFKVNVNGHTEKKRVDDRTELTYLSWPFAWSEVKKRYPDVKYEVQKFNGLPYAYDPNTGYMVYTTVTIEGTTHEMWLPVMDGKNKAMKAEPYTYEVKKYDPKTKTRISTTQTVAAATMFDINKTLMRCLVKNLAMFGLGLYIYAGEDLPEEAGQSTTAEEKPLTDAERASQAYPSREEMIYTIRANIRPDITAKWLTKWGVDTMEAAEDVNIMGMYRYYESRGAFA